MATSAVAVRGQSMELCSNESVETYMAYIPVRGNSFYRICGTRFSLERSRCRLLTRSFIVCSTWNMKWNIRPGACTGNTNQLPNHWHYNLFSS